MKPDTELLAALGRHLRGLRATTGKPLSVTPPIAELEDAASIDRVLGLAESKWFIDRLVRSGAPNAPKWTFDLTTRGAEAFDLD